MEGGVPEDQKGKGAGIVDGKDDDEERAEWVVGVRPEEEEEEVYVEVDRQAVLGIAGQQA